MPFACNTFESIASPRKRSLEEEDVEGPSSKRPRQQPATRIPTPSRSAAHLSLMSKTRETTRLMRGFLRDYRPQKLVLANKPLNRLSMRPYT